MDEKELREEAIRRYNNSESPKEIYQDLGKSKACFLNWFATDDYNYYIYSRIIEFIGRMPFEVAEGGGMKATTKNRPVV